MPEIENLDGDYRETTDRIDAEDIKLERDIIDTYMDIVGPYISSLKRKVVL